MHRVGAGGWRLCLRLKSPQRADNERVILDIGQAADDDGADAACSRQKDRDAAAAGHVVAIGQSITFAKRLALGFAEEPHGERGPPEAHDGVSLAPDPFGIVGSGPGNAT